jgi:hypothetical protein
MFATDYSRAAKLVNGSTVYFPTNQGEIAVRIDISILDADIRAQDMFQEKSRSVIPAQAGIHLRIQRKTWIPVFTGMTNKNLWTSSRRNRNPSASSQEMFS